MATDTPKLWRRAVGAAKIETTTGTAISLSASDGAYNIFNMELQVESDSEDRNGQSALSMLAPIPGALGASANFTTEVYGSGSAGSADPWATQFLTSCGFTGASGVFTPLTSQAQTLTIGHYRDGLLELATGCQGAVTFNFTYGKSVKANWKFQGKFGGETDVALIAPTYPTRIPPKFVSASLSLTPAGGGAQTNWLVSELEIAVENEVYLRPDISDSTGYHAAFITGRKVKVKMDPEAVSVATQALKANREANLAFALSVVVGTTTGNIVTFAIPKMYMADPVKDKQRGNVHARDLTFVAARNAAAGDDELSVSFG